MVNSGEVGRLFGFDYEEESGVSSTGIPIQADVLMCPSCFAYSYSPGFYFDWTCKACGKESNYVEGKKALVESRK